MKFFQILTKRMLKQKNLSLTLKWESSLNPNVEAKGVSCTTSKRTINGANRKETIFT